ncbi:MAG: outer membrane protein transport protein [Myxococcales bacterium]|nr:outer membrane protein transport protein [Myxococcales bacterium]
MDEPYRMAPARTTGVVLFRSRGLAASLCALAVGAVAALSATPASASGFMFTKFGGDQGQPAIGSPYSVYFNPAAIGDAKGTQIVLDGMFAIRSASYDRPASALSPSAGKSATEPNYVAANTGKAKSTGIQGAPYFGVTTDFGGQPFFVGFASYVPEGGYASFGKATSWQSDKRGLGAYDGPQRWSLVSGAQVSWWNTLAAGTTIAPARLSIGISATIVRDSLESLIARNKDASDDLATATGLPTEGRSLVKVSGVHAALAFGLFWKPLEDGTLRLGASYTSPQGLSEARLKGTLRTQFGTAPEKAQDVDLLMSFPDVIRFGAAYLVSPKLDLRLDFEWVRWSRLQRQCVVNVDASCNINADTGAEIVPPGGDAKVLLNLDRRWKDAFGLRVGAGYFASSDLELMGSLGFDTSPVPKGRLDATYIEGFKLLFSVGARLKLAERWFVGATVTEMYMLPVDNSASTDLNNKLQQPSKSPSNGGKYTQSITFLDVNVGVKF